MGRITGGLPADVRRASPLQVRGAAYGTVGNLVLGFYRVGPVWILGPELLPVQ